MTAETLKRQAAERAVEFVESGMVLGLGTGSTARHVVDVVAERLRAGSLRDIRGVPTSEATRAHAQSSGIALARLDDVGACDLTIDGADEIDGRLDLIKGLGGALLWEKLVASASERLVIVADESKLVERLGERAPLPVEVVPFGHRLHIPFIEAMGARVRVRAADGLGPEDEGTPGDSGAVFITDGGHMILDCAFEGGIADPLRLEAALSARTGIVETGLFLGMANTACVATASGVRVLEADRG